MLATQISKSELEQFFQELPDMIDIEEIMERLYVLQKIHAGETDLKKGRTLSHNQVIERLSKKWQN
jgi:predicted transcriptional regulator